MLFHKASLKSSPKFVLLLLNKELNRMSEFKLFFILIHNF